jgi:hypothetical protein
MVWQRMYKDVAKAGKLMEECVQLRTRVLGVNHPHTIASSTSLGVAETEIGDWYIGHRRCHLQSGWSVT